MFDEDVIFRQNVAEELRRSEIDVVQLSDSARLLDMVEDQNPDLVFIDLNGARPHECVRALLALRECRYSGAVQIYGRCEVKTIESLNILGADCTLKMLPPVQKPIKVADIQRIIFEQKLATRHSHPGAALLADALAKKQIQVLFQPKFDLKSKMILGAEVVTRVAHPSLGLLSPDQFLKGADEESLVKLSRLVLIEAIEASVRFQQLGVALLVAINISADNLLRLPVADLMAAHRPACDDWLGLLLEIPERQIVNRIGLLKALWPKLRQSGVKIAIDNFGRGSSCLGVLKEMPFAEMKIDRSLVDGCAHNNESAAICKSLIDIARNFGSRSVAVGISNEADLGALLNFDCDVGQGFLLGKPVSAQQTEALITTFKRQVG